MGFFDVIKLLWSNWFESLPRILKDTGNGIEAAGESAIKASYFIKGGGNVPVNACGTIAETAQVIEECYQLVRTAALLIDTSGKEIDKVKIPTVEPTFTTVVGVKVVTGINFGEARLFGTVADGLKNGAADLNNVGTKLQTAASHLRQLKNALNQTGGDLYTAGTFLKEGGQKLKQLGGNQ